MLTSTLHDGSDLVEAVLDGAPDGPAIAVLRRQLTDAAGRHGGARVLVEVRRYEDPVAAADRQELRRLAGLPSVRRLVVVSSDAAFRTAATRLLAALPIACDVVGTRDEALARLEP
ncbi:hypothetical protein [Amnibacterium endophyticum]|uniref:Response regulatory domain-containing protein n=1 Tax=Amnibacterium endophyticum TaxID=2109337 RepID=A0ABW4LB50_9MICO